MPPSVINNPRSHVIRFTVIGKQLLWDTYFLLLLDVFSNEVFLVKPCPFTIQLSQNSNEDFFNL
jgi:hypothetical protein